MPRDSLQRQALRREWPQLIAALEQTFFQSDNWAVSTTDHHNPAGYLIVALREIEPLAQRVLGLLACSRNTLDRAWAAETRYIWHRGWRPRRPEAALPKCWLNLAKERSFRFDGRPHPVLPPQTPEFIANLANALAPPDQRRRS